MATAELLKNLAPVIGIGLLALIGAAIAKGLRPTKARTTGEQPRRRGLLTEREQAMYFRLKQAFPDHIVLAQVAFSALLTAKSTSTRNTFDRKAGDFVLLTKAFEVIAAIELDDASHKGRKPQDTARDELLTNAGYKVLRFAQVPDIEDLQAEVKAINAKAQPTKQAAST